MAILPVGIGASGPTQYQIERSLRFNSADSAYLNRTPGSAGNRKTWTVSFWLKKSIIETRTAVCGNPDASGLNGTYIEFNTSDLNVGDYGTSSWNWFLATYDVFRDPSAWYHFVIAVDTTQATASNRVKIYVNNRQITVFDSTTYPSLNADTFWNNNQAASIGRLGQYDGFYLNGYLTDFYNIGGQQLDPSSFGENDTDTGVWKPKAYTGSYGTNGFKLTFSDNSGTTATTLGKDTSGNGNNWTPNNFSVTAGAGNDSLVDTPTPYGSDTGAGGEVRGNYATLNPLQTGIDLSNGNLNFTNGAANESSYSTIGVSSGKWFCEAVFTSYTSTSILGIAREGSTTTSSYIGSNSGSYGWDANGNKYNNGSGTAYGSARTANDVIGCALDLDAGTVTFYLNGVSQGTAYSSLPAGTYFFGISSNSSTGNINFGQRPFAYTAPSGYKALCTTNLPTPAIGATSTTRADDYFNTVLYTGNSTVRSITGVGFSPDFTWIKRRDPADDHYLFDSVRTATKYLSSNSTAAETTNTNSLTSFDSDGFSLGISSTTNSNTNPFVAWNWRGSDSSAVSNTQGTITSTVSANTTSGFSIVTYTGNATSNQTVGHGLGVKPDMFIIKSRSSNPSPGWIVWHRSVCSGNGKALALEETNALQGPFATPMWDSSNTTTQSSSTVVTIGANTTINTSGHNYVMYCFAPVAGYSAFGSFTGNGSADGPFIYLGFRPKYFMWKVSSNTSSWLIFDAARNSYNAADKLLYPNNSNAEDTVVGGDFLSNGFKIRQTGTSYNANGETYIYAAFAENPFKYSLAR